MNNAKAAEAGASVSDIDSATAEWEHFCETVRQTGIRCLRSRPDLTRRELQDGLQFLTRLLADGSRMLVGVPDPHRPYMYRIIDELAPFGMPNADAYYITSNELVPGATYRLTVRSGGRPFIASIGKSKGWALWGYQEMGEIHSSQLKPESDGRIELLLSPNEQLGNWFRTPPEFNCVHIRDFMYDWNVEPGWFHLERLDDDARVSGKTLSAEIPARLRNAARWFEETCQTWSNYADRWRSETPNTFSDPVVVDAGSHNLITYHVGWLKLKPNQVAIVECPQTDAAYWSIQLYTRWGTNISPSVAHSSLSHISAKKEKDGSSRVMISDHDVGVSNWLDTQGYSDLVIWHRIVGAKTESSAPKLKIVTTEQAIQEFRDVGQISLDERAEIMDARETAIARRWRR